MSGVNRTLMIPIALGLISLAACVPIPVDHTMGRVVDPKTVLEIRVTTKEEIIARAGEPYKVWERERVIAYKWWHANWYVFDDQGYSGTTPASRSHYVYADQMLLIQFDESGRVARAEKVELPSEKAYAEAEAEFVTEWAKGKADAKP